MLPFGQERALVGGCLYRQVRAAEAHIRLAEQNTLPTQSSPSEFAKHQEVRPAEMKRPLQQSNAQQQAGDKHIYTPLQATCSPGKVG